MFKAIDLFELGGNTDWSTAFKNLYDSLKSERKKVFEASLPKQILNTKPSLLLNDYAGTYSDELFGTVKIVSENDQLKVVVNSVLNGTLSHFHFNTFQVIYTKKERTADYYTFQLDAAGKVSTLIINDITYKRK